MLYLTEWYGGTIPPYQPYPLNIKNFDSKTVLIPKENNRRYFLDISHHAVCLL